MDRQWLLQVMHLHRACHELRREKPGCFCRVPYCRCRGTVLPHPNAENKTQGIDNERIARQAAGGR